MLKIDLENHMFQTLEQSQLKSERILEKFDLQKTIVQSWELFRNEIGLPSSYLIGQEIRPHQSTQNSIDILAFDPDNSSLIVLELKRDKNKYQLLQALSYAAMVSTWDSDKLISQIQKDYNPEPEELMDLIKDSDLSTEVKVILVSEYNDPEVIITTDWLSSSYSVDITAFAVLTYKMGEQTFLSLEQRYPLKELADAYEVRTKRRTKKLDIEWEDVLPKLKYPFAKEGIELCRRIQEGDAGRRRFNQIRKDHDGFTSVSLNFREKYINIYLRGNFEGDQEFLQSKFRKKIEINTWRDGLSFLVTHPNQFEDLVKWLDLS